MSKSDHGHEAFENTISNDQPNSDEDQTPPPTRKLGHLRRLKALKVQSPSDSDEIQGPPRKRARLRRGKPSTAEISDDENVAQLANEVDEDRILESRLRTRRKTAFQQNLEKLKRRKLKLEGETEEAKSDCEEDMESSEPLNGAVPTGEHNDTDQFFSSDESDAFIVEDDGVFQLPPQFSMETHQDMSLRFKKIFQFFVHVAVQPAAARGAYMEQQMQDNEYFSVPLQVTRRKLSGLRDSLVSSSVWKPAFTRSLEKYPDFQLVELDFAVPYCDACHLGGRMSTFLGRLSGFQYNKNGFETVPREDHDSEKGESSKEFHLGRFCARRTRVFHHFCHWEYDLFQSILQEVKGIRTSPSKTFHPMAFFKGKEPPEDPNDADGLCDWLDQRRIIDMEWQRLKNMMESARHLELGERKREKDD